MAAIKREKFLIPEFSGEYIQIYKPAGDVYRGEDTERFRKDAYYSEWITNDFSILKDGNQWHMVGITHPKPEGFVSGFEYEGGTHEAEFQLFHCIADGCDFKDVFFEESFKENEKILYPKDRIGERPEIWAPHLMRYDKKYQVIYSPQEMRRMSTTDFKKWEKHSPLFACKSAVARDPYIYEEDGRYYAIYTEEGQLKYRVSEDMEIWSEEKILQKQLFANCECESPFLMKREGVYYLFWCIYDGHNGSYDDRTLVFASKTIDGFYDLAPITMLKAHAPEIIQEENGNCYLLSVFYPQNGISAVKLCWK